MTTPSLHIFQIPQVLHIFSPVVDVRCKGVFLWWWCQDNQSSSHQGFSLVRHLLSQVYGNLHYMLIFLLDILCPVPGVPRLRLTPPVNREFALRERSTPSNGTDTNSGCVLDREGPSIMLSQSNILYHTMVHISVYVGNPICMRHIAQMYLFCKW